MAARGISLHKVQQFWTTITSAALEWLLIFLLFIHAIFSYSITKFARYCNLQVPCLLCSRLDHVLGREKHGFYWDLICRHHKLEISSLIVCHVHNKLVDVHSVCENCLFSFATINKSNAETYRLLVGKLGEEPPAGFDDEQFEDPKHGDSKMRVCSCCNELYILRNHAQNLLDSHFDIDDTKSCRKASVRTRGCFHDMTDVEYSKVKNFSDTESEIPFSDDDDGVSLFRESRRDFTGYRIPVVPRVISRDLISEKFINTDAMSEISLLDLQGKIGNNGLEESKSSNIGHGLEEISWLHVEPKVNASVAARKSDSLSEMSSDGIVTEVQEPKAPVGSKETVELDQTSSKKVAKEVTKPVIEPETSAELPVELDQTSSKKVANEVTKPVIEPETSAELPCNVNDKVTKTVQSEQISSGKATVEEAKLEIERKPSSELASVVDDKLTGPVKLEKVGSEKITSEDIKPVIEVRASPEISSVVKDKNKEAVEMEQTVTEKGTHEDIKPVIEQEKSPEIQPVVNNKVTETVELEQTSSKKVIDTEMKPVIERGSSSEIQSVANDSINQISDNLDLGEAYKLAVGNKRRGRLFEQRSLKDSARLSEDFKLLLSQISASRGIDLPFISPRVSENVDETRNDSSSCIGTQIPQPQRKISLERNESFLTLDGSGIAEIEGESEVDRLKRQVEHDKKLMSALYKELEEERNASGIAANQAMAMMTRLQEEKAALQMEALQCVRMMEEQAEYDEEALEKANDLLTEKEKEIQDLEADLEYLRSKLENISMIQGDMESSSGLESREFTAEQTDSNNLKNSENIGSNSTVDKPQSLSKDGSTYDSYSEFEDERFYVLECLRKLEKKLQLFSNDGVNLDVENTVNMPTKDAKEGVLREPDCKEGSQEISSREGIKSHSGVSRMADAVAIGDEVSHLIKRLESLEAEHNGISHSLKSLQKGDRETKSQSGDSLTPQGSSCQKKDQEAKPQSGDSFAPKGSALQKRDQEETKPQSGDGLAPHGSALPKGAQENKPHSGDSVAPQSLDLYKGHQDKPQSGDNMAPHGSAFQKGDQESKPQSGDNFALQGSAQKGDQETKPQSGDSLAPHGSALQKGDHEETKPQSGDSLAPQGSAQKGDQETKPLSGDSLAPQGSAIQKGDHEETKPQSGDSLAPQGSAQKGDQESKPQSGNSLAPQGSALQKGDHEETKPQSGDSLAPQGSALQKGVQKTKPQSGSSLAPQGSALPKGDQETKSQSGDMVPQSSTLPKGDEETKPQSGNSLAPQSSVKK